MSGARMGQIAVLFISQRTQEDAAGYEAAAAEMVALAGAQPGYAGIESARGDDGMGITISYWTDEASAIAWRDHPEHARIRALGRERWYRWYEVVVTQAQRAYRWEK